MTMIHWGGVSCCLSAAALYLLGRRTGRDVEILKSTTPVNQLKELAQLLDAGNFPLVIAISGRIGSESPINCELSGLRGVIVEEMAEQHYVANNSSGSWIQDSANTSILSTRKEVPWYLEDATGRVHVVEARGAMDFVLPVETEAFEGSDESLGHGTLDYFHGIKMLGVKRIERVLPIGTSLTVVGEAAKDDDGTIRIQRPYKGPFYVSQQTIDQLTVNLGKWARWYKCASMGLTIFGAYVIAKHVIQHLLVRRRRYKPQKRVLAAAAKRSGQDNEGLKADTLPNGGRRMPDLCVICLEQEYNAVWAYVLLYNMFFTLNYLSTLPATDRAGCENLPSLRLN
ncbi:E3 ubiquitin-protein ligase SP1, partial [Mucuna pruriens]